MTDFQWGSFEEFAQNIFGTVQSEADHVETLGDITGHQIALDPEIGDGRAEYILIGDMLRIAILDCTWHVPRVYNVVDNDWIRFNFSLDLDIDMEIGDIGLKHVDNPSWRIIHMPKGAKTIETLPKGGATKWVTVCCHADRVEELSGIKMENLPSPLGSLTGEVDDFHIYRSFDLNHKLISLTSEMMNTPLKGGLRLSYMVTKATELVLLALDYVINLPNSDEILVVLSDRDRKLIRQTRDHITENLSNIPTVQELSRIVGLNRNKLFYGFKAEYGKTISEFIQDLRLEEGYRLLTETPDNIYDVAFSLGYQHQCNFSTAIKGRYGFTPSQLRQSALRK